MPVPSGFDHTPTTKSNSTRSIATHPFDKLRAGSCKKRKDGAPSVGMVLATIVKGGPPALNMDDKVHEILVSDTTTTLGQMHRSILRSAHTMDEKRWVQVKKNGFSTQKWTDFGNEVGADEINWWITRRESDVDELLARTKATLKAAQILKKASENLKDGEPDSYEKLLLLMKSFHCCPGKLSR